MKITIPRAIAGCCIAIMALVVVPMLCFVFFITPDNSRDNANPRRRAEMVELTLRWGRLAPFPGTAREFAIRTEGSAFTRTFRGSFADSPEVISKWLRDSRGVTEGQTSAQEGRPVKTILKTGEGASYGEVIVAPDHSTCHSWSRGASWQGTRDPSEPRFFSAAMRPLLQEGQDAFHKNPSADGRSPVQHS